MKYERIFAITGIIMISCESIIAIYLFFTQQDRNYLFFAIGLLIIGYSIEIIIIKTNYDPFSEFSCWASILSLFFLILGLSLFPWTPASKHYLRHLYDAIICFSIAIYLSIWNLHALTRKKQQEGT